MPPQGNRGFEEDFSDVMEEDVFCFKKVPTATCNMEQQVPSASIQISRHIEEASSAQRAKNGQAIRTTYPSLPVLLRNGGSSLPSIASNGGHARQTDGSVQVALSELSRVHWTRIASPSSHPSTPLEQRKTIARKMRREVEEARAQLRRGGGCS